MEILRAGARKKIEFALQTKTLFYDPGLRYALRPRFFTIGGLVFSGMSRNYLQEWGKNWQSDAPLPLRYVHTYATELREFQGKRDIVVLSNRLAHPVNTYAGPYMDEILLKVNGRFINSVEDIPKIIAAEKGEFLIFEFLTQDTPLVLDRQAALEADTSIIQQYQVPLSSWFGSERDDGATANWEDSKP